MKLTKPPKATVNLIHSTADPLASQGARRATEGADGSAPPTRPPVFDSEVIAHAKRRRFSPADKRRILAAAERCKPGELGALLRREGVYSSSLSNWRRQRETGELAALAPTKRGPKADPHRAETLQVAKLTRELERLRVQLGKAQLIIDVQKKVAALLGHTLDQNGEPI
jgi:transposase